MSKATLRVVLLLVAALAIPGLSPAQSLGSVAKKERERRDKNKEKGVVSHEYTEEEVFGEKDEDEGKDAQEGDAPDSVNEGDAKPDPDKASSPLPDPFDSKTDAAPEDPDKESRDRRRSEAEWKARMQQARANVSAAREQVRILSELYLAQGERYVDENGKTVVSSPEQLQHLTQQAKDELAAAEKALKDLEDQARRAGVPPGWLR
jgi:hypothetical protein